MDALANAIADKIFDTPEPPCLSLYQPTHRQLPERQQDPIRFRNLVRMLEESLRQEYGQRDLPPLLEPFHALADDFRFWNHTLDGLAVLSAPGFFQVYRLQRPVPELAIVAESFHLKPLLRTLQLADRFQVLALSRQEVKLFEGNRYVLDQDELAPGVPRTVSDALGTELKEPHLEVWSYGLGASGAGVVYGQAGRADEVDRDTERFFRAVDRAILEHHSRPSGLPLLLAGLPENIALFQRISHNPYLLPEGIGAHPDSLSADEFRQRVWQAVEPYYLTRLEGLIEAFGAARAHWLGSDDLAQTARAAAAGRVATLLIEADRQIPGRLDPTTGRIEFDDLANPGVDDLLDDVGELVLKNGGQVIVVPAERMPTQSGLAAIYRY